MVPDFSGYATKAGLRCSDGRTIMPDAFKHQDKMTVPLVWQHGHTDPANVLGHAVLENRDGDVYCYGYFNDTPSGLSSKVLVQHKDITSLSIYANNLVEKSKQVLHGAIREVSLVLSGANPGALIDNVTVAHGGGDFDTLEDEAIIFTGLELEHADGSGDTSGPTVQDIYDSMTQEQKDVVHFMVGAALEGADGAAAHADGDTAGIADGVADAGTGDGTADGTADDTADGAADDKAGDKSSDKSNDKNTEDNLNHKEGTADMSRNVFDQSGGATGEKRATISHSDIRGIVEDAKKPGNTLRTAVESYALAHGIENIDTLFPDAKSLQDRPEWIRRRNEWVAGVINGTRHTPFSRIKTMTADLTHEDARAKGYIKGTLKKEQFFAVFKRVTTPQTIYKKQQLDRDDIIDITDFDVVAWLKEEMRFMLEEELARAVLIGDGREVDDPDKINEANIRPIATDDELYVTTINVNIDDANSDWNEVVEEVLLARRYYKGSGQPTMYTTEETLTRMLLSKDGFGRRRYDTTQALAAALRVSDVVAVEVMEDDPSLLAIIVNLSDYALGADRGGDINFFDDFDIDYNQYKYLIETRVSGALTKVKSAMVVRRTAGTNVLRTPPAPTFVEATGVVTIPTSTGVVYKNADTNATLTAGAQTALAPGATLNVVAVPAAGSYFETSEVDDFSFTRPSA